MHCSSFVACAVRSMLGTKLVTPPSAVIIHWLAPGTSCATPRPPIRFGPWSSENTVHPPGAALAGNESCPAAIESVRGISPPDTFGVQSVAVCAEFFGCDTDVLVVEGAAAGLLSWPPRITSKVATSAITASTTRPATISHGSFEPDPPGGGPGG